MSTRTEPTTREAIAHHARTLFEELGYHDASVRTIAAAAGVDPALVIRHFGSKELLFIEVVGLASFEAPLLGKDTATLGRRLAEFMLAPERSELRIRLRALVRASDREAVRDELRQAINRMFIDELVRVLPGADAAARAQLIGVQLSSFAQASDGADSPSADLDRDRLVDLCARAIQALVDAG